MPTILIAEDETTIAEAVGYALRAEGFAAEHVLLGAAVLPRIQAGGVDLLILDVGLPDMTGFDVCRGVRAASDVPVIFLTARQGEVDRVLGLELGADDYVVKPFSPRELVARVRACLRRRTPRSAPPAEGGPPAGLPVACGAPWGRARGGCRRCRCRCAHAAACCCRRRWCCSCCCRCCNSSLLQFLPAAVLLAAVPAASAGTSGRSNRPGN